MIAKLGIAVVKAGASAFEGPLLVIRGSYEDVLGLVLFVLKRRIQWWQRSKNPIKDGGIRGIFRGRDEDKWGRVGRRKVGIFTGVPHYVKVEMSTKNIISYFSHYILEK